MTDDGAQVVGTDLAEGRRLERRAIVGSIIGASALGALALGWGIAAQSRVLIFDGAFVVLGIVLSAVSLVASRAASSEPTAQFPFGKQAITPLAVSVQGVALLGTLIYAAADAIAIIAAGGSDVSAGTVAVYGLVTMACSFALASWLRRRAPGSDLVDAEVAQWRAGALLSLVYAAGAVVALLLAAWSLHSIVRYVDPGLVLLACVVLLPVPFRLLRSAVRELLEAAPPPEVSQAIDVAIQAARAEFDLPEPVVRATKLGERLYVEVDFVVLPGVWDVSGEDQVRRALIGRLEALGYELWANVELTTDPQLTV